MNRIPVTNKEYEELERLAVIVNNKKNGLTSRKIARAEYFNILKQAKNRLMM